jgi:hypothetical protein
MPQSCVPRQPPVVDANKAVFSVKNKFIFLKKKKGEAKSKH